MRVESGFSRRMLVGLLSCAMLSCDSGTQPEGPGEPASLQIVSGDEQDGVVGQQLDDPLVARVVDDEGRPVQGQVVNFVVVSGGGSVFAGSSSSNAQGIVQERWTLGTSTGVEQRVEARAVDNDTGEPIVFATFTATAVPDVPASMEKLAGEGAGTAGAAVAPPPSVRVEDQYGNPVPGVPVTFAVTSGSGTATGAMPTTGVDGIATVGSWTLGPTAGAQTMTAAVTGVTPVTFTVVAAPAPATRLAFSTAPPATTASGAALPTIVVRLEDQFGNIVPQAGVNITAELASGEGTVSGTLTRATDAQGLASFHLVITGTPGLKTIRFSAAGLTAVVSAPITVGVGQPTTMTKHAGDNQEIPAGGTAIDPAVRITDAAGTPVPGVTVTFAIVAGGGSLTGATPVTDANGVATVGSWTVGTTLGNASVRASAPGVSPVTFTATVTATAATAMTKSGGDNQTGPAGSTLPTGPSVLLTDRFGNPVAGVPVTFTVTSGGGSVANPNAVSGANGIATAGGWTLGTAAGTQTLTAASPGLPTLTFTATATPAAGRVISKISGDNQVGDPGEPLPQQLVVRVTDPLGNPISGAEIEWRPGQGGSATGNLACVFPQRPCDFRAYGITDEQGHARATWRTGTGGEVQNLEVRARFTPAPEPVVFTAAVRPGMFASDVTAGNTHSCALRDGVAYCWGINGTGFPGDGSTTASLRPVRVVNAPQFTSLTAEHFRSYGLTASGELWTWASSAMTPVRTLVPHPLIQYEAWSNMGCGLTAEGEASPCSDLNPTELRFRSVSVGFRHGCAVGVDQRVYCWGEIQSPALGGRDPSDLSTAKPIASSSTYSAVAAGGYFTCAITTAGELHCWGQNSHLQLNTSTVTPVAGLQGKTIASVDAGSWHVCAITTTGEAYCWGDDSSGQLGDGGGFLSATEPRRVVGDQRWKRISAGNSQTCGIASTDALYCWGFGYATGTGQTQNLPEPNLVKAPESP